MMKKLAIAALLLLMAAMAFADAYTIGTGTSAASAMPFNGLWDYSWSKVIYTQAEINDAGLTGAASFSGIGFYVGNTPNSYTMLDQRVYARLTNMMTYDTTDNDHPDFNDFQFLFQGDLTYNGGGWFYIVFTTPFDWDGNQNIEFLFENWDGDYVTGYPTFRYTSTTPTYKAVSKNQDNSFPAGLAGARSYNRPNIQLITPTTTPPDPAVLVGPADGSTYAALQPTFNWMPGNIWLDGYRINIGTDNPPTNILNNEDLENVTTYTHPTPFAHETTIYWQVIPYNTYGVATACPVWSFTTYPDGFVTVGEGNQNALMPFNFYYKSSLHQALYFENELGFTSRTITAMKLYNLFTSNITNTPVKIWMGSTAQTDLSVGYIPSTEMSLVFDGTIDLPSGANDISIMLDTPYIHTAGNLVVMFLRPLDGQYYSSTDYFKCQTIGTNRARNTYSNSIVYDPATPPAGTLTGQFPKTSFIYEIPQNDLGCRSIIGNTIAEVNQVSSYTVRIRNCGSQAQDNYTVKLYSSDGIELASQGGTSIAPGEEQDYMLSFIPSEVGNLTIYGKVLLTGDENTLNDKTYDLTIYVVPPRTIYFNDFEIAAGNEWSHNVITTAPAGHKFLGRFSNDDVSLSLSDIPSHTSVKVEFDLYIINSWDGNGQYGPDFWEFKVDGESQLYTTFAIHTSFGQRQSYPGEYPSDYPARTGAIENDVLGWGTDDYGDSIYRIRRIIPHSSPELLLNFIASNLQEINDESWGIDNIIISYDDQVLSEFEVSVNSGIRPLRVEFEDKSIASLNTITSWAWDFNNDGEIDSYQQNPAWIYPKAGTYSVSLTVSDGIHENTITKTNLIEVRLPLEGNYGIASPTGNTQWLVGSYQNIEWVLPDDVSNIALEYSTDNGTSWTEIAHSISSSLYSYNWLIPGSPSPNCKIRIKDRAAPQVLFESDVFEIYRPIDDLIVIEPKEGAFLTCGSVQDIYWFADSSIDTIDIEYSNDEGSTWHTIAENIAAQLFQYSWAIPEDSSTNSLLRLTANTGIETIRTVSIVHSTLNLGLIAHYPLNGNVNDVSGNGRHGTAHGLVNASDRFGNENMAMRFIDKTDYITIPPVTNSTVSVSMWYYFEGTNGVWNTLVYCEHDRHHLLINNNSWQIGFWWNNTFFSSGTSLQQYKWYHICMVMSGTSYQLYLNGSLIMDATNSFDNANHPFSIIGNGFGDHQGALGILDDIRIFDRSLTEKEVKELCFNGTQVSLKGRIVGSDASDIGLSGVSVILGGDLQSVFTSRNGLFSFDGLSSNARYLLKFSKPGYAENLMWCDIPNHNLDLGTIMLFNSTNLIAEVNATQLPDASKATIEWGMAARNALAREASTQTREFEGYSLYRLRDGEEQNPASWTLVTSLNVLSYEDTGWYALPFGVYKYAVVNNYTGGYQGDAVFSNKIYRRDFSYEEDFDHEGSVPPGWNITHSGTTSHPWMPVLDSDTDYSFKVKNTEYKTANEILYSPLYNCSRYDKVNVSFWHSYEPNTNSQGRFQYSLNGVTWTTLLM